MGRLTPARSSSLIFPIDLADQPSRQPPSHRGHRPHTGHTGHTGVGIHAAWGELVTQGPGKPLELRNHSAAHVVPEQPCITPVLPFLGRAKTSPRSGRHVYDILRAPMHWTAHNTAELSGSSSKTHLPQQLKRPPTSQAVPPKQVRIAPPPRIPDLHTCTSINTSIPYINCFTFRGGAICPAQDAIAGSYSAQHMPNQR